jgi:predicted transposase/invertase (TIGR01784 family)
LEKYGKQPVKGDTKMDLWMRYFTEMTGRTRVPAPELLADPDIAKAIGLLEVINYNDAELYLYDKYWDAVSIEATWKGIGRRDGEKAGVEKGLQRGLQQGLEEGRAVERRQLALNMLAEGLDPAIVAKISGLTEEELQNLTRE